MGKLPSENAMASVDFTFDARPLAQPANPFRWFADKLNRAEFPNDQVVAEMVKLRDWLIRLHKADPEFVHQDPVLLLAAVRAASSGADREWLDRAIGLVDAQVGPIPTSLPSET